MKLPEPESVFEGFAVKSVLGTGGFATVFEAHRVSDGEAVALKVLTPDAVNGYATGTRARFGREVAILERLRAPQTVRLLGHGTSSEGLLYLAFEHLAGQDLSELLGTEGRLGQDLVIAILRQVLTSLAEAHDAKLLHRDLKPHNIRVLWVRGSEVEIRLMDFGIARSTDNGAPTVTAAGELIGTPRYMSPEQLLGAPLDATSDIYSLGMVALELLMGPQALRGNSIVEQVERMRSGHLFSVTEIEPGLMAVITRMTARKPTDRYERAQQVLNALDALGHAPTIAVRRPSRDAGGDRSIAGPLVVLAGLLVCIGAMGSYAWTERQAAEAEMTATSRSLPTALLRVQASSPSPKRPAVPVPEAADEAAPQGGCGQPTPFVGEGNIDDIAAYVPASYQPNRRHAVLIVIQDKYQRPEEFIAQSGFTPLAETHGFVIVAPNDLLTASGGEELVPLIRERLERIQQRLCIDPRRVFVAAQGKAGRTAMALGCQPWVTAIGVNSHLPAAMFTENYCDTAKPAIWLSPRNSREVPLDGSEGCTKAAGQPLPRLPLAHFEQNWRERNACRPVGQAESLRGATCTSWQCAAAFRSCIVDGGSQWPGTKPTAKLEQRCPGETSTDFATAAEMWSFFDAQKFQ